MNTFKNIILVLPILFIGCGEDPEPAFVECEWANVVMEANDWLANDTYEFTWHLYTMADPLPPDPNQNRTNRKCIYIHYYKDGNYLTYARHYANSEDEEAMFESVPITVDLDYAFDFEYEEK